LFGGAGRAKLAAGAAVGALACAGGLAAPGVTQAQVTPIRHVVVIYLENHSFDNPLGYWCGGHPGRCPDGGMPTYTDTTAATFAGILAYTEHTFGLSPLGANDAAAYPFSNAFNYAQAPLKPWAWCTGPSRRPRSAST
jgi:hypothetical protein